MTLSPADARTPAAGAAAGALAGSALEDALPRLLERTLAAVTAGRAQRGGPVPAITPPDLAGRVADALGGEPLPAIGVGCSDALDPLVELLAYGAADPADPACAAHLHCPPLAVAVAADLAAAILNPSLDSWDQAPAAISFERAAVDALARLVGFAPGAADGTVTSGGTASNIMGLLLARKRAERLATTASDPLHVFCSEAAHFSVATAADLLGLRSGAVRLVPVDDAHRMRPDALASALAARRGPAVVVATAGTTDAGAVDPLGPIAALCAAHGAWLHVDAAYGGGALFSDRLRPLLRGLERADSIALDMHKLGWQPLAAGVFLVREAARMDPLAVQVAYLNAADDAACGYEGLLGRSLRTSRRADAFRLVVTMRALGRSGLGQLVDRCHALALDAAERITAHPRLELTLAPVLTTVLFRYRASGDRDRVNAALRRRLLREGRAVIGRTEIGDGEQRSLCLKLTLLNPEATPADIEALLEAVVDAGRAEEGVS